MNNEGFVNVIVERIAGDVNVHAFTQSAYLPAKFKFEELVRSYIPRKTASATTEKMVKKALEDGRFIINKGNPDKEVELVVMECTVRNE